MGMAQSDMHAAQAQIEQANPTIHAHQPLDVYQDPYTLVTITHWDADEVITQRFVMPYTTKTVNWLDSLKDLDVSVQNEPIDVMAAPKAVHSIITFENGEVTTACSLQYRRWQKYHQTLDQAFHRVWEKPTCRTCLRAIKNSVYEGPLNAGELQGAVLKQWSWDNVDPDFRPDGPKHHHNRTAE